MRGSSSGSGVDCSALLDDSSSLGSWHMLTLVEPTPVQLALALHSVAETEQSGKQTLAAAPELTHTVPEAQSDKVVQDGALLPPHATITLATTSDNKQQMTPIGCFIQSPIVYNPD